MKFEISTNRYPDINRLLHLFRLAGWHDKLDETRIRTMIENSSIVITAWHKNKMIGFAWCLTDFVFNGQINNVIVDEEYIGRGIEFDVRSKLSN